MEPESSLLCFSPPQAHILIHIRRDHTHRSKICVQSAAYVFHKVYKLATVVEQGIGSVRAVIVAQMLWRNG
jgi:hypothetical protein